MAIMMSRKALEEYGLVNLGNINWNLSPAVLVEHALARNEGILAINARRSSKSKIIAVCERVLSIRGSVRKLGTHRIVNPGRFVVKSLLFARKNN